MQELSLNFPTVVILLVILALAVLAIRRMTRRGLCDCGDHCGDGEGGCAVLPGSRGYGPSRRQGRGGSGPAPSVTVWRRQCERGSEVSAPSLFFLRAPCYDDLTCSIRRLLW